MKTYYFIVDTDSYSGNFEREICAYMTGTVGDCGVGEENRQRFNSEVDDELCKEVQENIRPEPDDNGCSRPAKIYPTPGWFNNGTGSMYRNDDPEAPKDGDRYSAYLSVAIGLYLSPSQKVIDLFKERAFKYDGLTRFAKKAELNVTGFRLITKEVVTTETAL